MFFISILQKKSVLPVTGKDSKSTMKRESLSYLCFRLRLFFFLFFLKKLKVNFNSGETVLLTMTSNSQIPFSGCFEQRKIEVGLDVSNVICLRCCQSKNMQIASA